MEEPKSHPVYRSINKPLTIAGADRRLFFMAVVLGVATFNLFSSFIGGVVMFCSLYLFARWCMRTDPQLLFILLNSSNTRSRYDPSKRERIPIERKKR